MISDMAVFGFQASEHSFKFRNAIVRLSHTPLNALYKRLLMDGERNYILVKRQFVMFKDPGNGEGLFSSIKF